MGDKMKVIELIKRLEKYSPDQEIMFQMIGYDQAGETAFFELSFVTIYFYDYKILTIQLSEN